MAENFPVLWQYRCKICGMANSQPDIFKDLHIQVLEVGMSQSRAMAYINNRIDAENIQIPKLNAQNMSVHFASHITIPEKVNHEIVKVNQPTTNVALKDVNPEIGSFVEDLVRRKVGNEVTDYLNLDSLRAQMMDKLELLDGIIEKTTPNGDKIVDLDAMTHYTALLREIRGCIGDLNKIRQSKQLMSMVVKSLMEANTFETVRKLSREYDQIKMDLLQHGVDQSVVTNIDTQLRLKLAEVVADTARSAVANIIRTYKLS